MSPSLLKILSEGADVACTEPYIYYVGFNIKQHERVETPTIIKEFIATFTSIVPAGQKTTNPSSTERGVSEIEFGLLGTESLPIFLWKKQELANGDKSSPSSHAPTANLTHSARRKRMSCDSTRSIDNVRRRGRLRRCRHGHHRHQKCRWSHNFRPIRGRSNGSNK